MYQRFNSYLSLCKEDKIEKTSFKTIFTIQIQSCETTCTSIAVVKKQIKREFIETYARFCYHLQVMHFLTHLVICAAVINQCNKLPDFRKDVLSPIFRFKLSLSS